MQHPAQSDLLAGRPAAFESGDVDPAHDVAAFEFDADTCLTLRPVRPVLGF